MKIKFPVLINGIPQFNTFVDFINKYGVLWLNGEIPTHYENFCRNNSNVEFPLYIFYNAGISKRHLTYYRKKSLLYDYGNQSEEYIDSRSKEVEFTS